MAGGMEVAPKSNQSKSTRYHVGGRQEYSLQVYSTASAGPPTAYLQGAILLICFDVALLATVGALPGSASLFDRRGRRVRILCVMDLPLQRLLLLAGVAALLVSVEPSFLALEPRGFQLSIM